MRSKPHEAETTMSGPPAQQLDRPSRLFRFLSVLLLGLVLPGCPKNWLVDPIAGPNCVLSPNSSAAQIVDHLNTRIMTVNAWRSTDVKIQTGGPLGIPIKLSGMIAVERPRNFRLMVNSIAGQEADVGSNREQFWFWIRRSQPQHVFLASHEQMPVVQQRLRVPFDPDWLMETLGIMPLDPAEFQLYPSGDVAGVLSLVSERRAADGRVIRRVIRVDSCQGHVVAHELFGQDGQLIARAELNDYRVNSVTGVAMPHRIDLDSPRSGMVTTIRLGEIAVNPMSIPERTWDVPTYRDYPPYDLAAGARAVPAPQSPSAAGRARVQPPGELPPVFEESAAAGSGSAPWASGSSEPEWASETGSPEWSQPTAQPAWPSQHQQQTPYGAGRPAAPPAARGPWPATSMRAF